MISFVSFQMDDTGPIYLQILMYIKRGIVAGTVLDGDELPSRRVLSALLGVNPNTVQKAYRLLEEEHLVRSHAGAKSFVVADAPTIDRLRAELLKTDATSIISSLRQMGLSKEEALALIDKHWDTADTHTGGIV